MRLRKMTVYHWDDGYWAPCLVTEWQTQLLRLLANEEPLPTDPRAVKTLERMERKALVYLEDSKWWLTESGQSFIDNLVEMEEKASGPP